MKAFLIAALFLLLSSQSHAQASAASYYSAGQQTNPGANTVLANTGALNSGGILGANYDVSLLLNGSVAQDYKLEVLTSGGVVVQTIWLSSPGGQVTQINTRAKFYIPNGYSIRIRNNTGVILGGTLQASIILQTIDLIYQ